MLHCTRGADSMPPSDFSEAGEGAGAAGDGEVASIRARATPSTQIGAPAADFDELMRSLAPRGTASKTPNASKDSHRRRGKGAEGSSGRGASKATGSDGRGREESSRIGKGSSTSRSQTAVKHGARRERRDAPETDRAGGGAAKEGVEVRARSIRQMDSRPFLVRGRVCSPSVPRFE